MNTTSQLTKSIYPLINIRKFYVNNDVANKHCISTHELCSPQNSPILIH